MNMFLTTLLVMNADIDAIITPIGEVMAVVHVDCIKTAVLLYHGCCNASPCSTITRITQAQWPGHLPLTNQIITSTAWSAADAADTQIKHTAIEDACPKGVLLQLHVLLPNVGQSVEQILQ